MKNFKHLLTMIVILSISISSCSKDDNNDHNFHLERINVVNAELPDELIMVILIKLRLI